MLGHTPLMKTLVFIPFPLFGHLFSSIEMAKHIIERDERLSITILLFTPSSDTNINSIANVSLNTRIHFVHLRKNNPINLAALMRSPTTSLIRFMETLRDDVRDEVLKIKKDSNLVGFIIDLVCTSMIDVAKEFKVPTYAYFTSGAAVLGLMFHLQSIRDDHNQGLIGILEDLDMEHSVPTYVHMFPGRLIPSPVFDGDITFLDLFKRLRDTEGILINTFKELECDAIQALMVDEKIPPVYPVGPILHNVSGKEELNEENKQKQDEIIRWLNDQPDSSTVFLCFGSSGSFDENQVKEIALALEQSGHRFLWSLRKPPSQDVVEFPSDFEDLKEFLPEGFLERTVRMGKVIGWAPQMSVLSHNAVGGFVSHCGWNSVLESIWCGVPIAVWPLGAEQHANAFQMVREFGVGVEIQMDYKKNGYVIVMADKIANSIKQLMDPRNEMRRKVNVMKKSGELAIIKGGSSYESLGRLLDNFNQS